MNRGIAAKLNKTILWALGLPAVLIPAGAMIAAVHDAHVTSASFECLAWRAPARRVAAPPERGRVFIRNGSGERFSISADELPRALADRLAGFRAETPQEARAIECGIVDGSAADAWIVGRNESEHRLVFFWALVAFGPLFAWIGLNRWWAWLVKPLA